MRIPKNILVPVLLTAIVAIPLPAFAGDGIDFYNVNTVFYTIIAVAALNCLFSVCNIFWKNRVLSAFNILFTVPYVFLTMLLMIFSSEQALVPLFVVLLEIFLIIKSFGKKKVNEVKDQKLEDLL